MTKAVSISRDYQTRKDRKVQDLLQEGLRLMVDELYESGYLDPEHNIVEVQITIRNLEEDVSGLLS